MRALPITGEYPPDWKAISDATWAALRSMASGPVVLYMAFAALAAQVGQCVRLNVASQPEGTERHDMSNGQLLGQFILRNPAVGTAVIVPGASKVALKFPVGPIVFGGSALPVRTLVRDELFGKPFNPATITAKSLRRFGWANRPNLSAGDTGVGHARLLVMRVALARTMAAQLGPRGRKREILPAGRACQDDGHAKASQSTVVRQRKTA